MKHVFISVIVSFFASGAFAQVDSANIPQYLQFGKSAQIIEKIAHPFIIHACESRLKPGARVRRMAGAIYPKQNPIWVIAFMTWPVFIFGAVCFYFGLTLFGIWYMSVRSRYWTRLNGVVVSRYESSSRSHGDEVEYVPAISVQICRNDELIQLHFPNPSSVLDVGEVMVVCVHPRFPRLFYCKYEPEADLSLLGIAGKLFMLMSALALLIGSMFAFSVALGVYWF